MSTLSIKLNAAGEVLPADTADFIAYRDDARGLYVAAVGYMRMEDAPAAVAAFNALGRTDWRLESPNEMAATADYTRRNPATDLAVHPGTKSDWYVTNQCLVNPDGTSDPDYVWVVSFLHGSVGCSLRNYKAFVRAVCSVGPASQ